MHPAVRGDQVTDVQVDRTTIEWFVGGHQINAKETFAFLKKNLDFPK